MFEIGERDADAYSSLGPYEIVMLNGTWSDFITKLEWATEQPMISDLPNVIVIDTVTRLWSDLKDWASARARSTERARRILHDDPDAEIEVTANFWNDAKSRWGRMLNLLTGWAGISVLIARAQEVTLFENGQPVRGADPVWSIDAEKNLAFNVTANVSIRSPRRPMLMTAKLPGLSIPVGGLALSDDEPLADLIFGTLATTAPEVTRPVGAAPGIPSIHAKADVLAVFTRHGFNETDAQAAAAAVWAEVVGPTEKGAEIPREDVAAAVKAAVDRLSAEPEPEPEPEPDMSNHVEDVPMVDPADPVEQSRRFLASLNNDDARDDSAATGE